MSIEARHLWWPTDYRPKDRPPVWYDQELGVWRPVAVTDEEMVREIAARTGQVVTASRLRDWSRKGLIASPEAGGGKARRREWGAGSLWDAVANIIMTSPGLAPVGFMKDLASFDVPGVRLADIQEVREEALELLAGRLPSENWFWYLPRFETPWTERHEQELGYWSVWGEMVLWWLLIREAMRHHKNLRQEAAGPDPEAGDEAAEFYEEYYRQNPGATEEQAVAAFLMHRVRGVRDAPKEGSPVVLVLEYADEAPDHVAVTVERETPIQAWLRAPKTPWRWEVAPGLLETRPEAPLPPSANIGEEQALRHIEVLGEYWIGSQRAVLPAIDYLCYVTFRVHGRGGTRDWFRALGPPLFYLGIDR